jgi:hypothetical protein
MKRGRGETEGITFKQNLIIEDKFFYSTSYEQVILYFDVFFAN